MKAIQYSELKIKDGRIIFTPEFIQIQHWWGDEILYWSKGEWEEPYTATTILKAIAHAVEEGAQGVCDRIHKCMSCREREDDR